MSGAYDMTSSWQAAAKYVRDKPVVKQYCLYTPALYSSDTTQVLLTE